MSSKITCFFAVIAIFAVNGFVASKLPLLEPILKCYEEKTHEFAGEKAMAASLNLKSNAEVLKLSCLTTEVSLQTKLMPDTN